MKVYVQSLCYLLRELVFDVNFCRKTPRTEGPVDENEVGTVEAEILFEVAQNLRDLLSSFNLHPVSFCAISSENLNNHIICRKFVKIYLFSSITEENIIHTKVL